MSKVILVSIDGMRPDGALACGNPFVRTLMERGSYTLTGRTVFPSVTLPCHTSMFHSVPPERHGVTTNDYTPQVRPVNGLFEQVVAQHKKTAMFYGWEPLRDVARPGSLTYSAYFNAFAEEHTDGILTDFALSCLRRSRPELLFLYMVETDEKGGHGSGWMSRPYLDYISAAFDNVRRVVEAYGDEYTVIVTADHGGHDRMHGTAQPEDMTVPTFLLGDRFAPGRELTDVSILDLAPTIADLMGVPAAPEWEGRLL